MVFFAACYFYIDRENVKPDLIAYSEFKAFVRQGVVRSVSVLHGVACDGAKILTLIR